MPNVLEDGSPSQDVWPDVPEWDEKQITCDFRFRAMKPSQFIDFVRCLNQEGRRILEVVSDPIPVFLSHHIVFFTALDQGGCEDCFHARRKMRMLGNTSCNNNNNNNSSISKQGGYLQQQHHQSQLLLQHSQASVASSCDEFDQIDDVMHKVHIMLHRDMQAVRIQVAMIHAQSHAILLLITAISTLGLSAWK